MNAIPFDVTGTTSTSGRERCTFKVVSDTTFFQDARVMSHAINFNALPDEQILNVFNHSSDLNEAIALSSTSKRMRSIFTDSVPGKALQFLDGHVDHNHPNKSRMTLSYNYWSSIATWGLTVNAAGPFFFVLGHIRLNGASQIVQFGKYIWPDHPDTDLFKVVDDIPFVQTSRGINLLRALIKSRVPNLGKRAMYFFYEKDVVPKERLFYSLIGDMVGPMDQTRLSWEMDLVSKLDEDEVIESDPDVGRWVASLSKHVFDRPQLATQVMQMLYPHLPSQTFAFIDSLPFIVRKAATDAEAVARINWVRQMNTELFTDESTGVSIPRDHRTILGAVHDSQDWEPDFIYQYTKALRTCKSKGWPLATALLQRDLDEYHSMLSSGNLKPWPPRPWMQD